MAKTAKVVQALMIAIAWTSAKVVRIRVTEAFVLDASTVAIGGKSYSVVAPAQVRISAGQVLYFVASESFPGFYYLCLYNGTSFACTCPLNATYRKACDHQKSALAFVTAKYEQRVEVERFIDEDIAVHVADEVRQARMERQFENLVSSAVA
jgi:hypothetical protein